MPWTSARKYLRTCGWCFACWKTKGRCVVGSEMTSGKVKEGATTLRVRGEGGE